MAVTARQPKFATMKDDVPPPRARHHQHRRRGELRQRPTNRDVDKQHAQRRVFQSCRRLQVKELPREQQGANRHRGRFGDERAQHRADRQNRRPPCGRCGTTSSRDTAEGRLSKPDDRPRRRERHDDDDEQGFRVIDGIADVVLGRPPTGVRRDRDEEHHRPQAEDHLDFPEEVQRLRAQTRQRRQAVCACLLIVPVLHAVCETGEARCRERVENRQEEHACSDGIERLDLHAHGEIRRQRLICGGWVTLQGPRNRSRRGCVVAHRGTDLPKLTG